MLCSRFMIRALIILVLFMYCSAAVHAKHVRTISTQSQLSEISDTFSIVSIRKYYSTVINHLAPIIKTSTSEPFALFSPSHPNTNTTFELDDSVHCAFTTVPSSFASQTLNFSQNCKPVDHITSIPLEAAHYLYLVLGIEPSLIISPNEHISLWSLIMKNAMLHETTRIALWNQTISQVFSIVPMYDRPYVVDYVLDGDISSGNSRGDVVKEIEEQVWNDLRIFEAGYEIQLREGKGLGFSSVSDSVQCNSTFYSSKFMETYHESLFRIDFYIHLMLKHSNLINSTGMIDNIPKIELNFKEDLVGQFNPTFLLESIRNILQQGGFNTFLSYSKPTLSHDMNYYTSLKSNYIIPISTLMIHPSCFSYYNTYAHQYFFRDSSMLAVIFNDIIYFSIAAIGLLLFIFNSVSYCLEFKIFVKKRILLPLTGPPTLIIISLCYTILLRSQFGTATYWILMVIVLFPAPILTGTYMVSLVEG